MPIGTVEVPITHVDEQPTVCIPVNVEWIPALLAMVSPARYPEFWAGTLSENRRARLEVQNLIYLISNMEACGDMASCCLPLYVIQRINPDTGLPEVSTNNGASWQPNPATLATKIVEPIPPVTSGIAATQCDASVNIMTNIQAWIDHVTNDFDVAADVTAFAFAVANGVLVAALAILGEIELAPIEEAVIAIIGAAMFEAWSAGKTVYTTYWTDAIKAQMLCIINTNIGSDGSFNDGQFSAMWNQFNHDLPGSIAKSLFLGFSSSVGRQGYNNMAAGGHADGSDCPCETCDLSTWGFFDDNSGVTVTKSGGDWEIEAQERDSGHWYVIIVSSGPADCCVIGSFGSSTFWTVANCALCGSEPDSVTTAPVTIATIPTEPLTAVLLRGNAPFTVPIHFS